MGDATCQAPSIVAVHRIQGEGTPVPVETFLERAAKGRAALSTDSSISSSFIFLPKVPQIFSLPYKQQNNKTLQPIPFFSTPQPPRALSQTLPPPHASFSPVEAPSQPSERWGDVPASSPSSNLSFPLWPCALCKAEPGAKQGLRCSCELVFVFVRETLSGYYV